MYLFYAIICACSLTFDWHDARVNALLNITKEALITSGRLLKEIEGNSTITTEKELRQKLKIIAEIANGFEEKYESKIRLSLNSEYTSDWLYYKKWYLTINKKAPLTFINKVARYMHLKKGMEIGTGVFNSKLFDEPTNISITNQIDLVGLYLDKFQELSENKYNLFGSNYLSFYDHSFLHAHDIVEELYQLFFYSSKSSQLSIFDFLTNTSVYIPESASIPVDLSPQLRLFNALKDLFDVDAFFCVQHQYFMALVKLFFKASNLLNRSELRVLDLFKQYWEERDVFDIMKSYEINFQLRNVKAYTKMKPALFSLARQFWIPYPSPQRFQVRLIDLEVFTTYVINEVDLNPDGSCKKTCSEYKQVERVFGCFDGGICSVQKQCKGKLWDCENIAYDPSYICSPWGHLENKERYKFIENYDDQSICPVKTQKAESWRRGFYKCNYCQCKCEESKQLSDRYFSLRPATSNIDDNYIVAGVHFNLIDHVVHLGVIEVKLLPNGEFDEFNFPTNTFNITDYGIVAGKDFQTITGNARAVCLDALESPNDHVLTGVRLKFQDGYFKLEIRMTQFDFATGMLYPEKSIWYSKDTDLNKRINLDDFEKEPENSLKSEGCFQFSTSNMDINFGQNTIPRINPNIAKSNRVALLSGAGMILQKGINSPVLSFQIITQDMAVYV